MLYNLVTNIQACRELIQQVAPTNLLYYSHIPTSLLALTAGSFVFIKGKRSLLSKLLLLISIFFSIWCVLDLVVWLKAYDSPLLMFSWSLLAFLNAVIFALSFYFVYVFVNKKDLSLKLKIFTAIPVLSILMLAPTAANLTGFDAINCEATEGTLVINYYYILNFLFFLGVMFVLINGLRKAKKGARKEIALLTIGISMFLVSFFSTGYVSALLDNFNYEFYGLFGMAVFIGFLSYLIVKFKAFSVKLIGTQALVIALIVLIGSEFFFIQNQTNKILTTITLALAAIFGYVLVRSVRKEIEAKAEIEEINKDLDLSRNQLQKANTRLQKLDKTKSEFLSIASHQLRTPISGIKGYLSMILEGDFGKVEDKPKEILKSIYDNTERLNGLVNDFLDVSRIERGKLTMERTPTDISAMIQSIVANFQPVADAKGLKLDYSPPKSSIPQVDVDPNKLRQVALNLVDNAIKYTSHGSIHVTLEGLEDRFRVSVKDTGVGLDPDEAKNLFRPFVRTADSSKSNATGSGLGLYVARKIVQYHGGKVWAESEGKGKGSTFCMEVPYDQSTLPEPEPEPYLE